MSQTNREKVEFVLNNHPETAFNRGKFMWAYLEEYHGARIYALKSQFLAFWKEEASVERVLRDVLRERKLPPKQDSLRYKKAEEFRKDYKKDNKFTGLFKNNTEKKQFEDTFGKIDDEIHNNT